MKNSKKTIIFQIIQTACLLLTFFGLFGNYYGLKISYLYGIISYGTLLISAIIIIIYDTKELLLKKTFLPLEITSFVSSIVILLIGTVFLIVFFLIKNI